MSNRLTRTLLSVGIATILELIVVGFFLSSGGNEGTSTINRLAVLLGGNFLTGGYIQFLEYVFFVIGMVEVIYLTNQLKKEERFLDTEILPLGDHKVIDSSDVNKIRVTVNNYLNEKRKNDQSMQFFLLTMIKQVATKFRANESIPESIEIVNSQSQINFLRSESLQSFIRYYAWALPTVGFIGTVLGISGALAIADTGDTALITSTLGVAFDTTLVALILSVILMSLIHGLQEKNEMLHANIQEFVMENLVNRIDVN